MMTARDVIADDLNHEEDLLRFLSGIGYMTGSVNSGAFATTAGSAFAVNSSTYWRDSYGSWTCSYCGGRRDSRHENCRGCGAPRL